MGILIAANHSEFGCLVTRSLGVWQHSLIAANHSAFGCLATLGVWESGNAEFGCLATRLATRSLGVWQRGVWVSGNAPRWRVRGGIGQYPAAIIEPHGFGRLVVVPVGNAMLADQKPEKAWC
jgi:hypothetical protein